MKLCDYGCGKDAKFQMSSGKWCCVDRWNDCSAVYERASLSQKETFKNGRPHPPGPIGLPAWNKGRTRENDERVKDKADRLKDGYASGKLQAYWTGRKHTPETRAILSAKCGGYRSRSGRGIRGWYEGYWCDSSWELAFVIYNLENGVKFERNYQGFEYEFEGVKSKFFPDFIMEDGSYLEIKGWLDARNKAKISQFDGRLKVLGKTEMEMYLNYAVKKYGKNFIEKYELKDRRIPKRVPKVLRDGKLVPRESKFCIECSNKIGNNNKTGLCVVCSSKRQRRKERPSKEVLECEIGVSSWTELSKKYGVSDNAVRKWARRYGLKWHIREKSTVPRFCECGRIFRNRDQSWCRECYRKFMRKNFPPKEQLELDMKTMGFSEIGKKYGVFRTTARDWAESYGLWTKKTLSVV